MSVVFVTGVSRGIGRKVAELFIHEGHTLYGCSRSGAFIEGARKIFKCDVKSTEGLKECADIIMKAEGKCDVVVNNAGITQDKTVQKMKLDQWREVIDTNLLGVHNCTSTFLSLLQESGRGNIVNISSVVALYGAFGQANYSASKAGVIGYSSSCALEFAKYSIRVNTVIPGYIETDMTNAIPEDIKKEIIAKIPLRRFGTTLEVAELVYFLSSDKASFITGGNFEVTGGYR